ncbi:MAG: alpha-hydroxy-acid oxidizing protein, partial [Candidatus Izemoplasmataceae bacterium]
AFDVVKSLALGAEAVGLSRFFLELVSTKTLEEAKRTTKDLLLEIKEIMVLLNAKSLTDLRHKDLVYDLELMNYLSQRK